MKPTENSLLLKADQQKTTFAKSDAKSDKPLGVKSARPMKSMGKMKSVRPQRIEVRGNMRKRTVKL